MNVELSQAWLTIQEMINGFFALLPKLIIGLVVFMIFYFVAKGIRRFTAGIAARSERSAHAGEVIGRLAQVAVIVVGLIVAVSIFTESVDAAGLLATLGIGGVAIGFAFKDVLQNFLAGILILWTQPFRVGDQIVFQEFEGTVYEIHTRATYMRTYDGRRVVIPNGELFTNAVTVNTAFDIRRTQYEVGIGYEDDIKTAKKLIYEVLDEVDGVLHSPAPDILTVGLADSAVLLRVRWWALPERADELQVQDEVITEIKYKLDAAGINIPFPIRTVFFTDETPREDGGPGGDGRDGRVSEPESSAQGGPSSLRSSG